MSIYVAKSDINTFFSYRYFPDQRYLLPFSTYSPPPDISVQCFFISIFSFAYSSAAFHTNKVALIESQGRVSESSGKLQQRSMGVK